MRPNQRIQHGKHKAKPKAERNISQYHDGKETKLAQFPHFPDDKTGSGKKTPLFQGHQPAAEHRPKASQILVRSEPPVSESRAGRGLSMRSLVPVPCQARGGLPFLCANACQLTENLLWASQQRSEVWEDSRHATSRAPGSALPPRKIEESPRPQESYPAGGKATGELSLPSQLQVPFQGRAMERVGLGLPRPGPGQQLDHGCEPHALACPPVMTPTPATERSWALLQCLQKQGSK